MALLIQCCWEGAENYCVRRAKHQHDDDDPADEEDNWWGTLGEKLVHLQQPNMFQRFFRKKETLSAEQSKVD